MKIIDNKNSKNLVPALLLIGIVFAGIQAIQAMFLRSSDAGKLGTPIQGLTDEQLRLFHEAKDTFKHEFLPEEGLGPAFNGRSCYECHGQPGAVGGEGRDISTTSVTRIGNRVGMKARLPLDEVISGLTQDDVDRLFDVGGPVLQTKSITREFPGKFPEHIVVEADMIPPRTELTSVRHTGPVFGLGLIDAIPDAAITQRMFQEADMNQNLAGRLAVQSDPFVERLRIGRFGYKAQFPTIMLFNIEAMRTEVGITSYAMPFEKYGDVEKQYPPALRQLLPGQPNDNGSNLVRLTYFQALLAPPPRKPFGEEAKRGEKIFDKLECSVCHAPVMYTAPKVYVPDPRSPAPELRWMEVKALENQPVRAYSDFLLHQMGNGLADGLPQNGAKGGEWRTAPLWWLSAKKFYLHNGQAKTLDAAIRAHGGQAEPVKQSYVNLSGKEKSELMAFLKSL